MTLDGRVVEFPIPSRDSQPRAMTCHSDSNIWFVETGANCLGRIAPDGTIVEFPVPTANASLRGIAVGADGDLWFTENFANKIGRMDLTAPWSVNTTFRPQKAERAASQRCPMGACSSPNMTLA